MRGVPPLLAMVQEEVVLQRRGNQGYEAQRMSEMSEMSWHAYKFRPTERRRNPADGPAMVLAPPRGRWSH